jgi:hypothetical protein
MKFILEDFRLLCFNEWVDSLPDANEDYTFHFTPCDNDIYILVTRSDGYELEISN